MKHCKKCNVEKEDSEFRLNPSRINPLRLRSQCIECDNATHREYYRRNKEKINTQTLAYQRQNPEKRKGYKLKLQYGSTLKQYKEMLHNQDGKCAICKTDNPVTKTKKSFCLDHDHSTGKVRGLLCDNCNKALGCFKDSPENLRAAIEYLDGTK